VRQAFVALALWVVLPGTAAAAATGTGTETTTPTLTPPPAVAPTPTPTAIEAMIVVRSSPLAGFQFHAGEELFAQMQVGDRLAAVRVEWRQVKLGYVPRRDNPQVARQMDLGAALEARVSRLRAARNPWDRIEFEVVLVLPR